MAGKKGAKNQIAKVLQETKIESITEFAERLMRNAEDTPSLAECFVAATDVAAYITAVRDRGVVLGSRYVPGTIRAVGDKALSGDIEAAKFLFDFLGLRVKAPAAQVNTAVQINIPTLKDILPTAELVEAEAEADGGIDRE